MIVSKCGRYKNNEDTYKPEAGILLRKQALSIPEVGGGACWFRETLRSSKTYNSITSPIQSI